MKLLPTMDSEAAASTCERHQLKLVASIFIILMMRETRANTYVN
jgi:hypothetical protein